MVAIVVYFESLHHAAAHAAQSAACSGDAAAATACADAASTSAIDAAAAPAMEELRLRYQQGLDLLLNAADLEQPCMAIFNEYEPITADELTEALGPSMLKKFKQLELYEVPCYACVVNPDAVDADDAEDVAASAAQTAANGVALQSATAKVFEFVQTVGFESEFEILQETNVKTFTM